MAESIQNKISTMSTRSTSNDIKEIQQKISNSERELSQLRMELEQTRQQAKQAEMHAQESGRTNRKLKGEIQTLTDMSNRKDRQAENAKATSFFFENQLKKYNDEIESAQQGMGHLKVLDDERRAAIEEQQRLELEAQQNYKQVREEIDATNASYKTEKEKLKTEITAAYEELLQLIQRVQNSQQQVHNRVAEEVPQAALNHVEREYEQIENEQRTTAVNVLNSLTELQAKLDDSEKLTLSQEQIMGEVKHDMDRIMRRLRAIDQAELN